MARGRVSVITKVKVALKRAIAERDRLLNEPCKTDAVCIELAQAEDRITKLKARLYRSSEYDRIRRDQDDRSIR
jgi:hypothetical protein